MEVDISRVLSGADCGLWTADCGLWIVREGCNLWAAARIK